MKFIQKKINSLACLVVVLTIASCGDEENTISFTAEQTSRLLSNDSTKSWLLINREIDGVLSTLEMCEAENSLAFGMATGDALNTLLFEDECDPIPIYDGFWQVLNQRALATSDTLIYLFNPDTLFQSEDSLFVDYDTLVNIIEQISSQNLILFREDTMSQPPVSFRETFQVTNQ